jgi:hypothetical protein
MSPWQRIIEKILADSRYQRRLDWGEPRKGHPEGTVRAHIAELLGNLETLRPRLSETDGWKLQILIHTHDSFKADAKPGAAITDPRSHASLAREFLASYTDDADLLAMVQFHDEPYALWRQLQLKGAFDHGRLEALFGRIQDWNLFLAFCLIDGCTSGKSRDPLRWLFEQAEGRVASTINAADIF